MPVKAKDESPRKFVEKSFIKKLAGLANDSTMLYVSPDVRSTPSYPEQLLRLFFNVFSGRQQVERVKEVRYVEIV
jgi:hypothetical protein